MEDIKPKCGPVFQGQCSLCNEPSKYRCPKCSTLSCSLNCVKAHKDETGCNGVRDKTAFVAVEEFKEVHLLSDLHFLEDIGRTIDNATRTKRNLGCYNFLPVHLFRLKRAAMFRKTDLQILPVVFSRRKMSTTYFRYSDKKIFWGLEWKFPLAGCTFYDEKIDEETLLGKCLDKYLLPEILNDVDDRLAYYQSMGHKDVAVLLKNENSVAKDINYHILNQNKSLKKNFARKKIIEFPTLLVVPKSHLSAYSLVE